MSLSRCFLSGVPSRRAGGVTYVSFSLEDMKLPGQSYPTLVLFVDRLYVRQQRRQVWQALQRIDPQ